MTDAHAAAMEYLLERTNYERTPTADFPYTDLKLDRMRMLLDGLGNPERIPCVHIAGTKGKGSTAHMLAAVLQAAGYRTGLFTSPHLEFFEERIRVDGIPIPETEIPRLVQNLQQAVEAIARENSAFHPTFFELVTALGWLWFRESQIDLAVIEVGLGGRLDSTNICHPVATAITSIGYDHTRQLGETLEEIAAEKAGIIKPRIPLVSGVTVREVSSVIESIAVEKKAPVLSLGREIESRNTEKRSGQTKDTWRVETPAKTRELELSLFGEHQGRNLALVAGLADCLIEAGYPIPESAFSVLANTSIPGRQEQLSESPLVILDCAHNLDSTKALADSLSQMPAQPSSRTLLFGCLKDKRPEEMLKVLEPHFSRMVLTTPEHADRSLAAETLFARIREYPELAVKSKPIANCHEALEVIWNELRGDDVLVICGSFYLAGDLRGPIRERVARKKRQSAMA